MPMQPDPFILETDTTSPLVNLHLWFAAGPPLDPPGQAGLSALMIRALIRGTKQRDRRAIEEAAEALGSELTTSTQRTAVGIGGSLLARHLDRFVDVLAEVATEPAFLEDEVDRTRRELDAELDALVDDDGALAQRWFRRTLFADTPFAHGTNGYKDSLARITTEDVKAWHQRTFCRAGLTVGASGPLDHTALTRVLAPILDRLPLGTPVDWALPEPPAVPPRIVVVDKPNRGQTQILTGHPTVHARHEDHLALSLATSAFGGTFTARLMQEVRVKRGLSYGAYAQLSGDRAGAHYALSAAPEAKDAVLTLELLHSEYRRFVHEGLTDAEIEFAREHLIASFAFSIETPALVAGQRVRARLLGRPDDHLATWRTRMAALTPDDVRAAVRRHLDPDRLCAVLVGDGATLAPALAPLGLPVSVQDPA